MSKTKVHGALFTVALFYSANYSVAKYAMPEHIQAFGFIIVRIVSSTAIFWILHAFGKQEPIKNRRDFWLLAKCGLFGVAMNQLLFFKGLSITTPINASILITAVPITVLVVAYFLGKERLNRIKVLGVILGAVGAYLLVTKDGVSISKGTFLGDLLVAVNGVSYAFYLVMVKPLMGKYQALTVIKWVFLFGAVIAFPFGIQEAIVVDWGNLPLIAWFSIIFVIIGVTVLVYLLNVWSLKYVESSTVGMYVYLQPVLASIIAIALGKDSLEIEEVVYSLLIMLGVYLVSKR
ncbi:MAG: DMT family transporter [Bacteroidota bacterium]